MILTQKQAWHEFYANRVGDSYQSYFKKRYKVMIDFITFNFSKNSIVIEEGIGIGSMAKALMPEGFQTYKGFDICAKVLRLCQKNVPGLWLYQDDIVNPKLRLKHNLAITHGVLEHFSDMDISRICTRYKREGVISVHYVPLDKYKEPSFGDERLLPYEHWLDLVNPIEYHLFNENHDLLFVV